FEKGDAMETETVPQPTKKERDTRRRGRGEGGITQRKDKRWQGSVSVGHIIDEKGNRRRQRKVVYGKTKAEVQAKLTRLQSKKLDGKLGASSKLSVEQFLDQWLAKRRKIQAPTEASYRSILKTHVKPAIGNIALSKLTPAHIEVFYKNMEDADL